MTLKTIGPGKGAALPLDPPLVGITFSWLSNCRIPSLSFYFPVLLSVTVNLSINLYVILFYYSVFHVVDVGKKRNYVQF